MLLAAAKYLDSTGNLQRATLNIADSLDPLTAGIPFAIQVQVLNPDDTLMVGSEAVITASLTTNPDGGSLQGATLVQVVGGVASFTDLSIDKVGSEYRLMFSSSGFDAITGDPAVVVAGQPAGLQFLQQPQAATSFQDLASPVSVPIVDAHGKPVGNAALDVTIDIKSNKGELILHASGPSDPDTAGEERLFELIDPAIPAALHWLPVNTGDEEVLEVVHSPSSGDLYAITRDNNNLFNGSAATGNMHLVCSGTLDEVKGVAFESGSMPRLLAVLSSGSSEDTDELFEIDLD